MTIFPTFMVVLGAAFALCVGAMLTTWHVALLLNHVARRTHGRPSVSYVQFFASRLMTWRTWRLLGALAIAVAVGFAAAVCLLAYYRTTLLHSLSGTGLHLTMRDTRQNATGVSSNVVFSADPLVLVDTAHPAEVDAVINAISLAPILRWRPNAEWEGRFQFQLYYVGSDKRERHVMEEFTYEPGRNLRFSSGWYSDWPLTKKSREFLDRWIGQAGRQET